MKWHMSAFVLTLYFGLKSHFHELLFVLMPANASETLK